MVGSNNGRNPKVSLGPVKQEETGEPQGYPKGLCRFCVEAVCFVCGLPVDLGSSHDDQVRVVRTIEAF